MFVGLVIKSRKLKKKKGRWCILKSKYVMKASVASRFAEGAQPWGDCVF